MAFVTRTINDALFYAKNSWFKTPQGRWPVCDRCGGENQTARFVIRPNISSR